jgi:hypothetical protein
VAKGQDPLKGHQGYWPFAKRSDIKPNEGLFAKWPISHKLSVCWRNTCKFQVPIFPLCNGGK